MCLQAKPAVSQHFSVNILTTKILGWTFFVPLPTHRVALWIQNKSSTRQIPTPGIEPGPRRWERRILTTRPRGKCSVLGRVLITAQSYGLAFIGHWPAWKFASSVRVNSMRLIIYFWSDFSVICQQKAVFPPSTSFRKYRMVIDLKKKRWQR